MKILVLTNHYPTAERPAINPAVLYQVEELRRQGLQVDVLHVNSIEKGSIEYLRLLVNLPAQWYGGHYDLLHVHFGGILALMGALVAGKRTVVTFHGTDLHGGMPNSLSRRIKSRMNVWCSKAAALLSGGVSVVSANLLDYLPPSVAEKTRIFPPGVEYNLFSPQPQAAARQALNLDLNCKYILFSTVRNSPIKRWDIALQVGDVLSHEYPNAQILKLESEPYWQVPLYLNAADCLLLTSDKEGSPNIVKEALAMNLPIVSVDVGDVRQRCEGLENCWISSQNVQELARNVGLALQHGRSICSRDVKRSEIDNTEICRLVRDLYSKVLNQAGRRPGIRKPV